MCTSADACILSSDCLHHVSVQLCQLFSFIIGVPEVVHASKEQTSLRKLCFKAHYCSDGMMILQSVYVFSREYYIPLFELLFELFWKLVDNLQDP